MSILDEPIQIDQRELEALESNGFTLHTFDGVETTGLYFTARLRGKDRDAIIAHLQPNHFEPLPNRNLFIGRFHWRDGGTGFYATSNVCGTYRAYRAHRSTNDFDTGNIFAAGKTLAECINNFLDNYRILRYNRR